MNGRVTICVPNYRGKRLLEESVRSIGAQTRRDFVVVMSLDEPDPACEAICRRFLDDPRFKLVIQPERLGWVGNFNWIMARVETEFCYYHQQDDLTDPTYIKVLVGHLGANPSAALAYCDLLPMGRIAGAFKQVPSVLGVTPYMRLMTMLHEHYGAFAFRGMVRAEAARRAGPVPTNAVDDFGVDICWLAAVARAGELHHVPAPLYRKRYHDDNTESKWWAWPLEKKLEAWPHHCVDMLNQAFAVGGTVEEMRLMWLAGVERLTSPRTARPFLGTSELSAEQRGRMFDRFMAVATASKVRDIPVLLDDGWPGIAEWTRRFLRTPAPGPIEIVAFGPRRVEAAKPFNVQPDGLSAMWLRAARRIPAGTRLRLDGRDLATAINLDRATAAVPAELTERPGELPLLLVDAEGRPRSDTVVFRVVAPAEPS